MGFGNGASFLNSMEAIIWLVRNYCSVAPLVTLTLYLLMSFGLYSIAKRRRLYRPWRAFLPIGSGWILGCIADHYLYMTKGKVRKRRTLLMILELICLVLAIVLCFSLLAAFRDLTEELEHIYRFSALIDAVLEVFEGSVCIAFLTAGVLLVCCIVKWVCCYALFASCDPENKISYLVFGILFPFLMAIFVFLCRRKDLGMQPVNTET